MFTTDELKRIKIFGILGETGLPRLAQRAADVRLVSGAVEQGYARGIGLWRGNGRSPAHVVLRRGAK
jgi:hypothetical protein